VQIRNIHILSKRGGKTASEYLRDIPMSDRENAIYEFSKAGTGFMVNSSLGDGRVDLVDCKIEGFRWGVVGKGALGGTNEFNNCTRGINATLG